MNVYVFKTHYMLVFTQKWKPEWEVSQVIPPWKPFPFSFPVYNKAKFLPWSHNLTPFTKKQNQNQISLEEIPQKNWQDIHAEMCICQYCFFLMAYSFKIFKKRSQILIDFQKNMHPKLSYIFMYFQDVFLFSLTIMLCFKGFFFWHKNICVNSMLTALTSPLVMEASS